MPEDETSELPSVKSRYYGFSFPVLGTQGMSHLQYAVSVRGGLLEVPLRDSAFKYGEEDRLV